MSRTREKLIIKKEELNVPNYRQNDKDITVIELPKRASVELDEVRFQKNIISKIEVFRFEGDKRSSIFVELYLGNIELATFITEKDIVVIKEYNGTTNGEKELDSIRIREVEDYDTK